MRLFALLPAALLCASCAQAVTLNLGAAYPLWGRAGAADISALGGKVSADLLSTGAEFTYSRGLSLPLLGAGSLQTRAQLSQSGVRLSASGAAALGPVALNLSGGYFTARASDIDPLADWTLLPTDTRRSGWDADLKLRYRLSRQWVGAVSGEFGPQNNGLIEAETHRDLSRLLPLAPGDDPSAPRETEPTGTLTYRAGLRAGKDVLGAVAGLTYATAAGNAFALDTQIGPEQQGNSGFGLRGSATFPEALGESSNLEFYAAYEPWRENAAYLRAGVAVTKPLGSGTLTLNVRGGEAKTAQTGNEAGAGISLNYAFALSGS